MAQSLSKAEVGVVRLLRCRKTHRYFGRDGWTADAAKARNFWDEQEAVRACLLYGLHDVELVLRVVGSEEDVFSTPVK